MKNPIYIKLHSISAALFSLSIFACLPQFSSAQHSVAREWNEVLLESIRNDFARPTVHARNLYHISTLMYDAWAAYDEKAETHFLGKTIDGFTCPFDTLPTVTNVKAAQETAISYAAYRLLRYRFQNSPGAAASLALMENKMSELGYNPFYTDTDYATNGAASLGNYLASQMITFGQQDGSNELNSYNNTYYFPINPTLAPAIPGNDNINDPNRWQPLTLSVFVDQSGNPIPGSSIPFLSPEWGNVVPFSLDFTDKKTNTRFGRDYQVYMDCGDPPYIDVQNAGGNTSEYQWGFSLVSIWSSHLDPLDTTLWDISPASIGNIQSYPNDIAGLQNFYNTIDGGDTGTGHALNPTTGMPYEPQLVKRSDYTRVLAEFWADGPDSETPPGHWFTILNYVNDNPLLEKRWQGAGPILDDLEWDVKTYFTLGGAVHDAAIVAWSNKGWYDYIRPVSAIRYMAERGQSTDTFGVNYDPLGLPLVPGKIELVEVGDPLAGNSNQNVGKVKLMAWKGPDYIVDPATDVAGVDWILAENWWPYQRPTFVTPPFAGYVSGHSTFSRAAAEIMTAMTGDPFFPGGMGEFEAPANEFLVFEQGPTENLTLQWATYRDASDQCSLSRIWGGIHPPADDIPGRLAGIDVGEKAFDFAESFIDPGNIPELVTITPSLDTITDIHAGEATFSLTLVFEEAMDTFQDPLIYFTTEDPQLSTINGNQNGSKWLNTYTYLAVYDVVNTSELLDNIVVNVEGVNNLSGNPMEAFSKFQPFYVNTKDATVITAQPSQTIISDLDAGSGTFGIIAQFDQAMDSTILPKIFFPVENTDGTLVLNTTSTYWLSDSSVHFIFDVLDLEVNLMDINVVIDSAKTKIGNNLAPFIQENAFSIDTQNPVVTSFLLSETLLGDPEVGMASFDLQLVFSEAMDTNSVPTLAFPNNDPSLQHLMINNDQSGWIGIDTYSFVFDLMDINETMLNIDLLFAEAKDQFQNIMMEDTRFAAFSIDTQNPEVSDIIPSVSEITKEQIGIEGFSLGIIFSEPMDANSIPNIRFPAEDPLAEVLVPNPTNSLWASDDLYIARFDVNNSIQTLEDIDILVDLGFDAAENALIPFTMVDAFDVNIQDTLSSGFVAHTPYADQLIIQPNPLELGQDLTLQFLGQVDLLKIELIDLQGKVHWSDNWLTQNQGTTLLLPTEQLNRGIYFVRARTNNQSWIQKILIL